MWIVPLLGSARDHVNDLIAMPEDLLRMAADSQVQSALTEAWLTFSLLRWTSHDLFLCICMGSRWE